MSTVLFAPRPRDQIAIRAAALAVEASKLARAFRGDADFPIDPGAAAMVLFLGASDLQAEVARSYPSKKSPLTQEHPAG
jgi:hypothetical protein